ncbi:hypothetical protein ACQJBY_051692 [Aegilops geniculata]
MWLALLCWFFVLTALWVDLPWNRLAKASAFFVVVHRSNLLLFALSACSCFWSVPRIHCASFQYKFSLLPLSLHMHVLYSNL